jgi:hypothetical protein
MSDTPEHSGGEVVLYESPAVSAVHGEMASFRGSGRPGVGLPRRDEPHLPDWELLRKYANVL